MAAQANSASGLRGFWLAHDDPQIRVLTKYPG
jgi:hypothetical protein